MEFNFSKRPAKKEEVDLFPNIPVLTVGRENDNKRDYRRFEPSVTAAKALTGAFISFVTGTEKEKTTVFIINHNEPKFTVSYQGAEFTKPSYEVTQRRTFHCKDLAVTLEEVGVIGDTREVEMVKITPPSWVPQGAIIYRLDKYEPIQAANNALKKVEVTVS